jgi:hypothetical protein
MDMIAVGKQIEVLLTHGMTQQMNPTLKGSRLKVDIALAPGYHV